jgi:hypothetical protein
MLPYRGTHDSRLCMIDREPFVVQDRSGERRRLTKEQSADMRAKRRERSMRISDFLHGSGKPLATSNIVRRHLHPALKVWDTSTRLQATTRPVITHSGDSETHFSATIRSVQGNCGTFGWDTQIRIWTIYTTRSGKIPPSARSGCGGWFRFQIARGCIECTENQSG